MNLGGACALEAERRPQFRRGQYRCGGERTNDAELAVAEKGGIRLGVTTLLDGRWLKGCTASVMSVGAQTDTVPRTREDGDGVAAGSAGLAAVSARSISSLRHAGRRRVTAQVIGGHGRPRRSASRGVEHTR